jgi:hypothetical protein
MALLLTSLFSSSQDASQISSSVLLPIELADINRWEPEMVQCDPSGNITVLRKSHHELIKTSQNGAVIARMDVSGQAGLGDAEVISFAPGPNDETYVLASHVTFFEVKRANPNKPPLQQRSRDLRPTFFRFDAYGTLISSRPLGRKFEMPWIAVLDSGDFLLFSFEEKNPVANFYSVEGKLLKQVDLKKARLGIPESTISWEAYLFGAGDKALVMIQESDPRTEARVTTISSDGEVLGTAKLKLPKGYTLRDPRRMGEHLFGILQIGLTGDPREGVPYVEIASDTGDILHRYKSSNGRFPACNTSEGMSFFNVLDQRLEILTLQAQSESHP